MKIVESLLLAMMGAQLANTSHVSIVPDTVFNGRSGGPMTSSVQTRKFVVSRNRGPEMSTGDVLLEWNVASNQMWWTYQSVGSSGPQSLDLLVNRYKVIFTPDSIVGFTLSQPFLGIRVMPGTRYANIDAAQAALLQEMEAGTPNTSTATHEVKLVNIAASLPLGFFILKGHAERGSDAMILEVSQRNGDWLLTVQGASGLLAKVALDSRFTLKTAVVVPSR